MTDFLLELLSEEIPARMQAKAASDLARLFGERLAQAGLNAGGIDSYATPRRLTLIVRDLPLQTEATAEERKGPRADAPEKALDGFLRSTGLTRDQLVERQDNKGNTVLFAVIEKPGRATADVIAQIVPDLVRAFPWPKSMRWGTASETTESLRWVRPLQGIVALLGEELVPIAIEGVTSGNSTAGHRFHHPDSVIIGSAADYAEKLRAAHVIVDPAERMAIIREGAERVAAAQGLTVVPDEGLVAENAGLTEWPVPLLGSFDEAFLDVPPEVIQLTMRTNQKYFACARADGSLAPNFICTANIVAKDDGRAIVAGNEKVLAARLSDAKFFWELDKKTPLAEQAKKLERITFHEKLGTVADKVDRVAKLARWLVEEGIVTARVPAQAGTQGDGTLQNSRLLPSQEHGSPSSVIPAKAGIQLPSNPQTNRPELDSALHQNDEAVQHLADMAEQAARLAKADLVTEMVGEFPELQGIMGGYYARAEGLPEDVADAIRDHYKPVGQADEVPTAPVTVAVSLADKLDTIIAFFVANEKPTGSKDPFALRRAALGIARLLTGASLRLPLNTAIKVHLENSVQLLSVLGARGAAAGWNKQGVEHGSGELVLATIGDLKDFLTDRLKVQQREAGVRHDLIDAVFALGGEDDLVRLLARVKALQSFVETEDGTNLLAGYKRAANILKKEGYDTPRVPAQAGTQGDDAQPGAERLSSREQGADQKPLSYTPETAEAALITALDAAEPRARAAVAAEDFEGAMAALASLRAPIDAFFDKVTVNDPDADKRDARLALLARVRDAVHQVADFSRIEG